MKLNKCVECGKGVPDSEGRCPACGGSASQDGLVTTENQGMAASDSPAGSDEGRKVAAPGSVTIEPDRLNNEELKAVAALFRLAAATGRLNYDAATDQFSIRLCWIEPEGESE